MVLVEADEEYYQRCYYASDDRPSNTPPRDRSSVQAVCYDRKTSGHDEEIDGSAHEGALVHGGKKEGGPPDSVIEVIQDGGSDLDTGFAPHGLARRHPQDDPVDTDTHENDSKHECQVSQGFKKVHEDVS